MTAGRRGARPVATEARPTGTATPAASSAPLRPRIVLAEDDRDMRDLVAWSLRKRGYDVIECASGAELIRRIDEWSRDRLGVEAAKLGVAAFFTEPFEIAKLFDLVDRILGQCSVRTERQRCHDGGGPATEEAE